MSGAVAERSDAEPMAPTREEAVRGAVWAVLAFNALVITTFAVAVIVDALANPSAHPASPMSYVWYYVNGVGIAAVVSLCVSLVAALVGFPFAWFLARSLRRTTAAGVHVAAFAVFGAAIGLAALLVFATLSTNWSTAFGTPLLPITIALTTISVLFGWWRASRHARRALVPPDPRSPIGLDEDPDDLF